MKRVLIGLLAFFLFASFNGARGAWVIERVETDGMPFIRGTGNSIAMDNNGIIHISCAHRLIPFSAWNKGLYYITKTSDSWEYNEVVSQSISTLHTSLAFDENNYPHIAYLERSDGPGTGRSVLKHAYKDENGWHIEPEPVDDGGVDLNGCDFPSIAFDSDHTLHIAYVVGRNIGYDEDDRDDPVALRYATRQGDGSWIYEDVESGLRVNGMFFFASLKFDGNTPCIAYMKRTYPSNSAHDFVKFAIKEGGYWDTEEVDNVTNIANGTGTSLAIDDFGYPHISYYRVVLSTNTISVRYAYKDAAGWHKEAFPSEWEWVNSSFLYFPWPSVPPPMTSIQLAMDNHPRISYSYFPDFETEILNPDEMPSISFIEQRDGSFSNWKVLPDPEGGGDIGNLPFPEEYVPAFNCNSMVFDRRWGQGHIAIATTHGLYYAYHNVGTLTTSSPEATYPNSCRHIETGISYDGEDFFRFIAYQSDYGVYVNWVLGSPHGYPPSLRIDNGQYPSLLAAFPAFPLLYTGACYTWQDRPYMKIYGYNSTEDVEWLKRCLFPGGWEYEDDITYLSPVSGILGTVATMDFGVVGGAVFQVNYQVNNNNEAHLYFVSFATREHPDWGYLPILEFTDLFSCSDPGNTIKFTPSIGMTAGDYYHVVFQDNGNIYYMMGEPIDPSEIGDSLNSNRVWLGEIPIPNYDPSYPRSHPFVETYGDQVYVSYAQTPEGATVADIWRLYREFEESYWPPIWNPYGNTGNGNISNSSYNSDFSTMAGPCFTLWEEEQNNYDILGYAWFEPGNDDEIPPIDAGRDRYPQCSWWTRGMPEDCTTGVDIAWTARRSGERYYLVGCLGYNWPGEGPYLLAGDNPDALPPPLFYEVETGKLIPSPYCKKRKWYTSNDEYSADYGDTLIYELPYLYPYKYYWLRAVLFVTGPSPDCRASVNFEGIKDTAISFYPGMPETLDILVPQECYKDTKIELMLRTLKNQNSVYVSHLSLYQLDLLKKPAKGGPMTSESKKPQDIISLEITPNLILQNAVIKYQLPLSSKASLKVYDISGKLIKNFALDKSPGFHTLIWNGEDTKDRRVPAGIYFIKLDTETKHLVRKVTIIR